jgi:hypothetical protein
MAELQETEEVRSSKNILLEASAFESRFDCGGGWLRKDS